MADLLNRRAFNKALAGVAAAAALPSFSVVSYGQNQPTKVQLTLPWLPIGSYAAFIVARDLGYWKSRGLDVEVARGYGSADASKKVGLGQFNYGDASFSVMLQTVAQGMDLVGLGLHMQISPLAVFTLKKSGIKSPKDLEGKTIGATPTTGDYHLFPAFAKAAGVDRSKVTFRFLDGNVRAQSLLDGRVDALTGYYSTDAAPLWTGGGEIDIMLYHSYGVRIYDTGLLALRPQIETFPEVTKAIVEGAMEGLKFTYLKPEETLDLHIKAVKEFQGSERSRETLKHQIAINTALGLHPGPKKNGLGWFVPEEVKSSVEVAKTYLELKNDINPEKVYTNKYLGSVRLTDDEWAGVEKGVKSYVLWS
ncbi:ABC transporter substrate-binding protein [Bradyrhizobium sp. NP1]|uniref:ABC transporter substrate-binding protein n=1 Tax=Bradyrhizobium sp. NP1 TaxID=3049772 RepID=UPI0025A68AFD|nr:ABC transporter substrate-binding protein [Bradyrhizobium sp. NP1]WJR77898.1 ABC transporter substrate-binding protein [Bradyrhizobium sp. NP1]